MDRASDGYRGEGKTDARDAYVSADQARMRRDLRPISPGDEAAIELRLLTGRRTDLVEDRTRSVNRLRGTLLSMFPALERALDVTNTAPQAADGLPDPGRDPPGRHHPADHMTGQPQGPKREGPGRDSCRGR